MLDIQTRTASVRYYSYSDKDQKEEVENKQPDVKRSHGESDLKVETYTVELLENIRSN